MAPFSRRGDGAAETPENGAVQMAAQDSFDVGMRRHDLFQLCRALQQADGIHVGDAGDERRMMHGNGGGAAGLFRQAFAQPLQPPRSEEHTSELQSPMPRSYAVFCLKTKT